jgi:hypothetical protein
VYRNKIFHVLILGFWIRESGGQVAFGFLLGGGLAGCDENIHAAGKEKIKRYAATAHLDVKRSNMSHFPLLFLSSPYQKFPIAHRKQHTVPPLLTSSIQSKFHPLTLWICIFPSNKDTNLQHHQEPRQENRWAALLSLKIGKLDTLRGPPADN